VASAIVVLPEHVILEIMKSLAVKDVIALSKVRLGVLFTVVVPA
jgi:hypothetical protein